MIGVAYNNMAETSVAVPVSISSEPDGGLSSPAPANRREFRGGFSSSICDIFRDPSRRTDCCSIACCGVLSSDRNRYLLFGELPPPLWRRLLMYLIIPALFIASLNYFAVEVKIPANGSSYGNNDQQGDNGDTTTIKVAPLPLRLAFYAYLIFLGIRGRIEKRKTRTEIMKKLYRERAEARGEAVVDPNQVTRYIHQHRLDVIRAHSSYSCCYAHDLPLDDNNEFEDAVEEDSCSRFWDCLSKTFWNACCGMWCQCCSACAIAQEEREIERLTGNLEPKMDYITFEPFSEYFPAIQHLNETQTRSFVQHAKAISKLSVKLLKNLAAVLAILVLFALSDIDKNFTFANMIVLLLTLCQAFFLEYLIWWRWNRFDISFDSVIKFFACGFLLTTPMAMIFELVVSIVTGLISMVAMIFILVEDSELLDKLQTDPKHAMKDLAVAHPALFIFSLFLNAFVIAALCEEMIKYFGYWMVVTPDLLPQKRSNDTNNENGGNTPNTKSVRSTGSGITVAMCSVALGFACCENLLYVFGYTPSQSLGVEIQTLIARSIFPVHPLCAAIQSIGVCRRDLEGQRGVGIGRIISPAILLHGSFDFVLMVAAYLQQVEKIKEGNDDDSDIPKEDDSDAVMSEEDIPTLVFSFGMVLVGYIYYVWQSRAQTKRFIAMDRTAAVDESSTLV
mmetsp:Transcript_14771/g.22217  ORF Transcript_14771/g.22217 Transcript_14771/m.22217 type:complete len:676 (-) Transcript_14771:39-2066(-)